MPKIEITKKERTGYIISPPKYVNCPYCFETNYLGVDDIYSDSGVTKVLCRFCKFSFRVEDFKNA